MCSIAFIVAVVVVVDIIAVASAQQMPVPARDSLEKWAAAQEGAQRHDPSLGGSSAAPQFSFLRAPKPTTMARDVVGVAGVAMGGKGAAGFSGAGAGAKARASFVGLGEPLPPGLAKRWKDPSVPIDIATEEVGFFL